MNVIAVLAVFVAVCSAKTPSDGRRGSDLSVPVKALQRAAAGAQQVEISIYMDECDTPLETFRAPTGQCLDYFGASVILHCRAGELDWTLFSLDSTCAGESTKNVTPLDQCQPLKYVYFQLSCVNGESSKPTVSTFESLSQATHVAQIFGLAKQ